jgi:dipeptidase E
MELLLISNSTNAGEGYLEFPRRNIGEFLAGCSTIVFIPYAAVTFTFDEYETKVNQSLQHAGLRVTSIHRAVNPVEAIENADAIMVGGGNTFHLVDKLYSNNLMDVIARKVKSGTPYVGWSAGANIACPSMKTTNDMPIVEPKSFATLGLVPFQINPHYLDANPDGHAGETREQRIMEFLAANKEVRVVGLREGTMLKITNRTIQLIGPRPARIFNYLSEPKEYSAGDAIGFLMK